MKARWMLVVSALALGLGPQPASAAEVVNADAVVHLTRVSPTHHWVETSRVVLKYGTDANSLGFTPRGHELEAQAPVAFDVDPQGHLIVADPVRQKLFRIDISKATPSLAPIATLPLPFSDVAVDRDGRVYVADLKSRTIKTVLGPPATTLVPDRGQSMRFLREGNRVVMQTATSDNLMDQGRLASWSATRVRKCNAEAGLLEVGGKKIQVEIGGPLASVRLLGINGAGDVFLIFEQFRQRGRIDVDRRVVVLGANGGLKAKLDIKDMPTVHPTREFVLGPQGALYQMVPNTQGVTFVRWEVRP